MNNEAITIYCCTAIVAVFCIEFICITLWKSKKTLSEHKHIIEFFPPSLSSLGVLGTFLGIFIGLQDFNEHNIQASIPELLGGLKTAFVTSLFGMALSLLLNSLINIFMDSEEKENPSEMDAVARQICDSVRTMSSQISETMAGLNRTIQNQSLAQSSYFANMTNTLLPELELLKENSNNVLTQLNNIPISISNVTNGLNSVLHEMAKADARIVELNEKIESENEKNIAAIREVSSYTGDMVDMVESINNYAMSTNEETKNLSSVLKSEVAVIATKMEESNALLTQKFDEFSELLQKNNTEALVKVMQAATEEFQRTMGDLVNKLVQENFEQLNKSVESLNQWQKDNKEMIAELTEKYRAMNEAFSQTSTILSDVSGDVKEMVGSNSKLSKIVTELQEVIVDDKKFSEMMNKLTEAINTTHDNINEMHDYSEKINNWVRNHQAIQDAVSDLITKLEALNGIRDYNEQFWQDTRKSLNDGVSIISGGTRELTNQISTLDRHFYDRLNSTLSNLDKCIKEMIDYSRNHRI